MKFLTRIAQVNRFKLCIVLSCLLVGSLFQQDSFAKRQSRSAAKEQITNIATTENQIETSEEAKAGEELTVWDIINMTDWLFWPFVMLTGAGISFMAYRVLLDHQDKTRSKLLLSQQITSANLNQIGGLVNMGGDSRISRLFKMMIMTFNKTNNAENLTDNVNGFLTEDRHSYDIFNRVMFFLSDTAGAMGLLGTVWGIFGTFYAGQLDGATILKGMSVSLITTLVGLVISVILNLGATTAYAMYSKQIELIGSRAEELRQALLSLQRSKTTQPRNGSTFRPATRNNQPAASPVLS